MASKALFNPFPGLRPFEPDEDHLFFGREQEIDELLRRFRATRFLQVVGTSGTGKSSLVRSGLIPALQSGFMVQAGSNWRVLIFRPGDDPIGNLAASLDAPDALGTEGELASTNRVLLEATLRRSTLGLVQAVRQARMPSQDNLLVIVDQFEELFRFRRSGHGGDSRNEAVAFFKLLLEAAKQEDIPIYVVLTMRSDFLGDCMEFQGLPEAVNAGLYLVPRMTRDEVRSAITGPVAVAGGDITQRLVLRLLNDLGDDHDQLPVLQHALMRTWDHWEAHHQPDQNIDVADYEAIGGLQQALSLHAEEAYLEAGSGRGHQVANKIFKALTDTFSDPRGVRRPTSIQELAAICEASEAEIIQIVEIFRRSGRSFLTPHADVNLDSRSIVDLSHESLMRCWTRLIAWAEEERESAITYMRIAQAASWCEECSGGLWIDPQLEIALQWRRKNQPTAAWAERYDSNFVLAMDFLDRGEKQREIERQRELRRKRELQGLSLGLAVFLVIASVFGYVAYKEGNRAKQNLSFAKRAVDESLSSAGSRQGREAPDSPEMEQFRKDLLDKAKAFYLNFTKQAGKNESVVSDAALGHSRLGDINRLLNLHKDAIEDYRQAISQFVALSREHPGNPYYRQKLAYAHHWTAETLRLWLEQEQKPSQYSPADAEKEYDAALSLQQELRREVPANLDYQQELARTYYNRGILHYDGKAYDLTAADFRQAIELLEPLATTKAQSPDQETRSQPKPSQDLARVYNNLGNLLSSKERRYAEARKLIEQAVSIHESLLKQDPANLEYKQELTQFYYSLAAVLYNEHELELAQQANHKALDLLQEVAAPSPFLSEALARASWLHDTILRDESRMKETYGESVGELQQHPEFHIMYTHLGRSYAQITKEYLRFDDLPEAANALEALHRLMPKLTPPERTELSATYEELRKELHDKQPKPR
jgi:tetratricopeptide (TPR) repeat protein